MRQKRISALIATTSVVLITCIALAEPPGMMGRNRDDRRDDKRQRVQEALQQRSGSEQRGRDSDQQRSTPALRQGGERAAALQQLGAGRDSSDRPEQRRGGDNAQLPSALQRRLPEGLRERSADDSGRANALQSSPGSSRSEAIEALKRSKAASDSPAASALKRNGPEGLERRMSPSGQDNPALSGIQRRGPQDNPALSGIQRRGPQDNPALSGIQRRGPQDNSALSGIQRRGPQDSPAAKLQQHEAGDSLEKKQGASQLGQSRPAAERLEQLRSAKSENNRLNSPAGQALQKTNPAAGKSPLERVQETRRQAKEGIAPLQKNVPAAANAALERRQEKLENLAGRAQAHQELRQQAQDLRQAKIEGIRSAGQALKLSRLDSQTKASLVGANLDPAKMNSLVDRGAILSRRDVMPQLGELKGKPRYELTKADLLEMHKGHIPGHLPPPPPGFGPVLRPIEIHKDVDIHYTNVNINLGSPYLLPAPLVPGVAPVSFSWNYWDGRACYDHGYAINLFVGLGHVRYGGYDGVVCGGSYFCYGYGWMDGCIDYGSSRMWVPGFWSSYVTEECYPGQEWVPPAYEDVWTGCCWERVQVDGGYFVDTPGDCHPVTHWTWVPGHFEFYA